MENVIRNDTTYIETYIKQNVGRVKSNPVFQKVYVNEWDKYFVSWDETTELSSPELTTPLPIPSNPNWKLWNSIIAFKDIVFHNDFGYMIDGDLSNLNERFYIDCVTNKISYTMTSTQSNYIGIHHSAIYCNLNNIIYIMPYRSAGSYPLWYIDTNKIHRYKTITDSSYSNLTINSYTYAGGVMDTKNKRIWFVPNHHNDASQTTALIHRDFHYIDVTTNDIGHITTANDDFPDYCNSNAGHNGGFFVDNKVYFIPKTYFTTKELLYYLDVSTATPTFTSYTNATDGITNVGKGYVPSNGVLYDKKIYLIPSNTLTNEIYYIDTTTNLIHKIVNTSDTPFVNNTTGIYSGGCLTPDGYIYMSPQSNELMNSNSKKWHRINVITNQIETYDVNNISYYRYNSSGTKITMNQAGKYFSNCKYHNGKVYFSLYSFIAGTNCDYPFQCYLDLNLEEDKKWNKNIHLLGC